MVSAPTINRSVSHSCITLLNIFLQSLVKCLSCFVHYRPTSLLKRSNYSHALSPTLQVESGTCFQQLLGSVPTGVILKDVSLEVHGGEVMAVLGSKGR